MEIFSYIRTQRNEYEQRSIPIFDGYDYSQYDTINQIDHYWVDSYVEEARDDVIGDYPFDNISKFRVLLEARATDFDTKHIEVPAINGSRKARISSMIATKALRKYMHETKFGKTINEICLNRPKYGGVLVKNTSEGVCVSKWENLITDQSDIMAGTRIERHYMTPSELSKKDGAWKNVKSAIRTAEDFRDKDIAETGGAEQAQTQGDLIEIFELQGDVKRSFLKEAEALMKGEDYDEEEDDDITYVHARIIACGADWVEKDGDKKTENGIVLYANEEKPSQKYLARNPMTGRGLGEGVIESLFEHQKWHNFTKTEEMRMIAIAGKKLYWTDDPDILANIFDEGVDHGTVLRVSQGKQLSELNQLPSGTPIYQNIRTEWADSADKTTSSFASKIGEEAKSGTPFRAQYLQNLEASSQFEQYREDIGFFLQEIVEEWLLPDALKKAAKEDEIYDTFSMNELQLIDEVIVENAILDEVVKASLKRKVLAPEDVEQIRIKTQEKLRKDGNKRTIRHIKDFIEKAGKNVIVHTTDEARNKAVLFESYANILSLLAPEDPRRNAIIDKIMEAVGITREELEVYAEQGVLGMAGGGNPKLETEQMNAENKPNAEKAMMNV